MELPSFEVKVNNNRPNQISKMLNKQKQDMKFSFTEISPLESFKEQRVDELLLELIFVKLDAFVERDEIEVNSFIM